MLDTLHNVHDALLEFFQHATNAAVCATYNMKEYREAEEKRHADYIKAVASLTDEQAALVEQFEQSVYEETGILNQNCYKAGFMDGVTFGVRAATKGSVFDE
jgi:hypothetical protein